MGTDRKVHLKKHTMKIIREYTVFVAGNMHQRKREKF